MRAPRLQIYIWKILNEMGKKLSLTYCSTNARPMKNLKRTLLMVMLAALVMTGCEREESEPPVVYDPDEEECPDGMTGPDCETEMRAQYIGEYEGEQEIFFPNDSTTTRDAMVNITASADDIEKIEIETTIIFPGDESTSTEAATVNEDGFIIPEHSETEDIDENSYTTTITGGYGGLEGTTLTYHHETEVFTVISGEETTSFTNSVITAEMQ